MRRSIWKQLTKDLRQRSIRYSFDSIDDLLKHAVADAPDKTLLLCMSNGAFGGIHKKLVDSWVIVNALLCSIMRAPSRLSGCANNQTRPAPPAMHPGTILEQLTDFEGGPFKVPSQKPRLQILEFWASWCAPCREAMPHMDRLFRQYHTQGLSVIAVSVDEDPNDALAMVAQMRPRFPVAWDPTVTYSMLLVLILYPRRYSSIPTDSHSCGW